MTKDKITKELYKDIWKGEGINKISISEKIIHTQTQQATQS